MYMEINFLQRIRRTDILWIQENVNLTNLATLMSLVLRQKWSHMVSILQAECVNDSGLMLLVL